MMAFNWMNSALAFSPLLNQIRVQSKGSQLKLYFVTTYTNQQTDITRQRPTKTTIRSTQCERFRGTISKISSAKFHRFEDRSEKCHWWPKVSKQTQCWPWTGIGLISVPKQHMEDTHQTKLIAEAGVLLWTDSSVSNVTLQKTVKTR